METTATMEASPASAVITRPRGWTECKQSEANYTEHCFCFHILTVA